MTDRELLMLAAKAAGYHVVVQYEDTGFERPDDRREFLSVDHGEWNPLTDDGDALRLAVALDLWPYASSDARIGVWSIQEDGRMRDRYGVDCWWGDCRVPGANYEESKQAATRRAIVRAAAAIGKAMP